MNATIVGAGISGLTAAVLLSKHGWDVTVFETREHIGGNCYDEEEDGILVHKYGPHIFHTDDEAVWDFLNRYIRFNDYRHRVMASTPFVPDKLIPIPYSKATEEVIGRSWSDEEIQDALFKDYSQKMWGSPWEDLPDVITQRIPKRRDDNNVEYFTDKHQGMPIGGYTKMFDNMVYTLGEGRVHTGCHEHDWMVHSKYSDLVVFTGSIDAYFDYKLGELQYRTLDFMFSRVLLEDRQPVAVINQCNKKRFTRTTDFSQFYDYSTSTFLVPVLLEYPRLYVKSFDDEPIYPMNWGSNERLASAYRAMTHHETDTVFCGRLGTYKDLDMDDAVKVAMAAVEPYL